MDGLVDVEDAFSQQALSAPWGELGRSATLGLVSLFSKLVVTVLNSFSVDGLDAFHRHVMSRQPGVGLITVCNHTRCGRAAGWPPAGGTGPCLLQRPASTASLPPP